MAIRTYTLHNPGVDDIPFGFDLSKWLLPEESIVDLDISVDIPGVIETHDPLFEAKRMLVWCRAAPGVTSGLVKVTMTLTSDTIPPRVEGRSFYIFLKES